MKRHTHSAHKHSKATRLWAAATAVVCMLGLPSHSQAQNVEGTDYYLPKTMLQFVVKVEKTVYTPGQFAQYAGRYMKKQPQLEASTSHRLLGIDMIPTAVPDTARHFTLITDKKHSISKVTRAENGQLLAINGEATILNNVLPTFTPAPKPAVLNPSDYMSADILNAGSRAKMAELTAQEIYDIRDSRNQLSRGEADNLPKDGEQLKLMFANLAQQEQALAQLFEGVTTKDTTWTVINYIPAKEGQEVLFRLSRYLGLVDADDLAGQPFYINIKDLHTVATPEPAPLDKKEEKNDIGLRVAQPSKIQAVVTDVNGNGVASYEVRAAQFGTVQKLSGELFGKKLSTRIILDPLTASIKTLETITAE